MAWQELIDEPWPAEGRTLGEIVERLVGPELWAHLLYLTGDSYPPGFRGGVYQPGYFHVSDDSRVLHQYDEHSRRACRLCLPVITAWNSGKIVAKARRGGPLEPSLEIPPPRVGYTLTIDSPMHSRVIDPSTLLRTRRLKFYDLRFWLSGPTPEQHGKKKRSSTEQWLASEIKLRTPPPPPAERRHGWITKYAVVLERKMNNDPSMTKKLVSSTIKNRVPRLLREMGLE